MKSKKITSLNPYVTSVNQKYVTAKDYNFLKEDFDDYMSADGVLKSDVISEQTLDAGVTVEGVLLKDGGIHSIYVATGTLIKTQIISNTAGTLGHASGVELVAATTGYVYEPISLTLIHDSDTAAYTSAGDDLKLRVGAVDVSGVIAKADLMAFADKIVQVSPLSTAGIAIVAGTNINLKATTAFAGATAAGVIRYKLLYRKHATGL